ncbi:unnamed protein product [Microthlaspi erraticum]|uniref:Uncharacterized protein n=1 Tax=Microthlaspi erraticum TaxID=1685480 RepID=A0A6D2I942_9BRAS|nr:unnamed protein product [Microthlaspi erraticum]
MVQEEKATLKPPQEGETEETIKEDPIPKPKQLAKQARSKTKAPTPKPPKGSTKIEDEAKPRRKVRKPRSGRNMKLLFPEELIDENLEGFKERVTRTLKLFPKAVVPRDIHGEIVYPAVNHPPDTHCKEKRLGGSRMPLDRRRKRCENTIRAKTLAADAQKNFGRAIPTGRPSRSSREGMLCSAGLIHRDRKRSRARANRERNAAIGRNFCIGTDRPCRSIRETYARPRPNFSTKRIWPTKSLDRDKIHRPSAQNFSRPR